MSTEMDEQVDDLDEEIKALKAENEDLRQKLEASLQVQFDAAAYEKVKRERDAAERAMREGLDGAIDELTRLLDLTGETDHESIHNEITRLQTLRGGTA